MTDPMSASGTKRSSSRFADALLGPYEPAEQLSPFEELGPGVARFERAGDRYLHGFQCTSESIAAVGGCQGERFANWSDDG